MKFLDLLNKSKSIIVAISTIIIISFSAVSYFAKASDLESLQKDYFQNKLYQRLNLLDQRITDLEIRYNCFKEECRENMPVELYREYLNKLKERSKIEKQWIK